VTQSLDEVRRDLVLGNRILAHEGILDAFGHVTVRHPTEPSHFLMAWARAPELIELADLMEFGPDGEVVHGHRFPYLERYIHAAIYETQPNTIAVCHCHTTSILPFSISRAVRLTPVIHTAAVLGGEAPVWDIADDFGSDTNLLVVKMEQARSLARTLGQGRVALMRGHGAVVSGISIPAVVSACLNMDKNARVQLQAMQLGDYTPLHPGELARPAVAPGESAVPDRGWEAYVRRVTDRA
jgi:ribulose-5-phosphate 4-epimerase/fuculose-1-phosphate aldolase